MLSKVHVSYTQYTGKCTSTPKDQVCAKYSGFAIYIGQKDAQEVFYLVILKFLLTFEKTTSI